MHSSDVIRAPWGRFDRYEVREGLIRPAFGAKFKKYDLWELYRHSKNEKYRVTQPPYQTILKLLFDVLGSCPSEPLQSAPNAQHSVSAYLSSITTEKLVTRWCAEYGLLGVLPHIFGTVVLSPQLHDVGANSEDTYQVRTTRYVRRNGAWESEPSFTTVGPRRYNVSDIGRSLSLDYSGLKPRAYVRHFEEHMGEDESLADTWWKFFPTVSANEAETYRYPQPLSPEFWPLYAESGESFVQHAIILRQAIEPIFRDSPLAQTVPRAVSRAYLDRLLEPAGESIVFSDEGRPMPIRRFPSLLSCFAWMAVEDASEGKRLLHCAGCGCPFVTVGYQTTYCTDKCAWKYRKRSARKKEDQFRQEDQIRVKKKRK